MNADDPKRNNLVGRPRLVIAVSSMQIPIDFVFMPCSMQCAPALFLVTTKVELTIFADVVMIPNRTKSTFDVPLRNLLEFGQPFLATGADNILGSVHRPMINAQSVGT